MLPYYYIQQNVFFLNSIYKIFSIIKKCIDFYFFRNNVCYIYNLIVKCNVDTKQPKSQMSYLIIGFELIRALLGNKHFYKVKKKIV